VSEPWAEVEAAAKGEDQMQIPEPQTPRRPDRGVGGACGARKAGARGSRLADGTLADPLNS